MFYILEATIFKENGLFYLAFGAFLKSLKIPVSIVFIGWHLYNEES